MRTNQKKRISLKTQASKNAVLRGMYETHFAGGDLYKESFSLVDHFCRILIGRNFIGWNSVKANCKNSSMFPIGWFNSRIRFKNRFFIAGHGGIRTSNSSKYQDRFQIARLLSYWSRASIWKFAQIWWNNNLYNFNWCFSKCHFTNKWSFQSFFPENSIFFKLWNELRKSKETTNLTSISVNNGKSKRWRIRRIFETVWIQKS